MVSAPGIGSGLDVNGIVSQLMAAEQRPLTALQSREQEQRAKLTAFGQVRSALDSFQTALKNLATGGKLGALAATSSDKTVFGASATAAASPGSYQIEVSQLAQSHKLASSGFANADTVVGTGTLTIQFGTFDGVDFSANPERDTASISIAPGQNTLGGIRDAINAAKAGVSASLVNDGSETRLVLTSTTTGEANSLKISVADDDGNATDDAGLSQLAYNPAGTAGNGKNLAQTLEARNAELDIDGIFVSSATNRVDTAISGVTLDLAKASPGTPLTLTIAADTAAMTDAVQSFVNAYNGASGLMKNLSAFKGVDATNGVLLGDATVRGIQTQMRAMLNTSVETGGSITTLSDIGVSFQANGTLALDSAKLKAAVADGSDKLAALFGSTARAADSLVGYKASTTATQPGNYALNVSQLASRGTAVGNAVAALTLSAGVNDTLDLNVNGKAISITLGAATYNSATALAAELQTRINGALADADSSHRVSAIQSGGMLSLTSTRYGSDSSVSISGGSALADLFGSVTTTTGVDVAGSIDGVAATGSGQILTAATGAASGLALDIRGGALGARGDISFGNGYAVSLSRYLESVLGTEGNLKARTEGLDATIKRLDTQQVAVEARLSAIEARYRSQFSSLDSLLSSMNTTSQFLTQQLASLAAQTS